LDTETYFSHVWTIPPTEPPFFVVFPSFLLPLSLLYLVHPSERRDFLEKEEEAAEIFDGLC